MVVDTTTIKTPNWQMSNTTYGAVVLDADDILQCIDNLLFTPKGQVPFDHEFGSLLYRMVDQPIDKLVPAVVNEIYDAISTYEKRVRIDSILPSVSAEAAEQGNVTFVISMTIVASAAPLEYNLNLTTTKGGGRAFSSGYSQSFS